jgi:hypothetical protein
LKRNITGTVYEMGWQYYDNENPGITMRRKMKIKDQI